MQCMEWSGRRALLVCSPQQCLASMDQVKLSTRALCSGKQVSKVMQRSVYGNVIQV